MNHEEKTLALHIRQTTIPDLGQRLHELLGYYIPIEVEWESFRNAPLSALHYLRNYIERLQKTLEQIAGEEKEASSLAAQLRRISIRQVPSNEAVELSFADGALCSMVNFNNIEGIPAETELHKTIGHFVAMTTTLRSHEHIR
ncbi:MAG: hypothetical protein KIS77_21850 [Saprospiraceae bacterium]|nr:hypothetical protein [Saprospiraceae bacterium]